MKRCVLVLLLTLGMATALPMAQAAPEPVPEPVLREDKCAPPCGQIFANIGLDPDLSKDLLATSKINEFPSEIPIDVTYSWDMEQDGTGVPGDTEDIVITMVITKKPSWLNAQIEPATCPFTLIPVKNKYEVCTVTLKTELNGQPLPNDEASFEELGKRLMVFATSTESGMFKKSYGVEDLRWRFDAAPEGAPPVTETTEEAPGPGALAVPLAATLAALVAGRRRRPDDPVH